VLGSGLLAWEDTKSLHVRRLRNGHEWRQYLPRSGPLALARHMVVLSLPPRMPGGAWKIYAVRDP
jgi:hypothetical protein